MSTTHIESEGQTPPYVSGGWPLLGHALEFSRNRTELFKRGYDEHGQVFALRLGLKNGAVVIGPDNQRTFFMETDERLNIRKPYSFLHAMFGEALFLAPHKKYLEQRPLVMELFRRQKMVHYINVMQEQVQRWLDSLGDSGETCLTDDINLLVQEIAGYCFLGQEAHERIGREFWDLYVDLNMGLDPMLPDSLPLPRFRRRDRAKARMTEILAPIIAERRRNPDAHNDFLQDVLGRASDVEKSEEVEISDEEIINLLLALMFAGHETTAGQGAWAVIQLLQHPDYLALVQEEIDAHVTPGERFDHRTMAKLMHISWAVRETERMKPSADMVMRMVDEPIEMGGFTIPEGWLMNVAADVAHNLPELWTKPEKYDPLRYAPDRAEDKQDRFALIGFGGGTHKCTGMNFANNEQTVIIAMLFSQFAVTLLTEEPTIERGVGANRPSKTHIRYRRRSAATSSGSTSPLLP